MKTWLLLLCCFSYGFIMAQNCRQHVLMQKGTQLVYKEYWLTASRQIPVARIVLEVDKVTDSAGSTWSSLTKRVFSNIDSNDHYERKLVLQCDGKNLLFPYDFFYTDTIYRRDFYPTDVATGRYRYAAVFMPLEDAITYIVPLAADCMVSLPEGKKQIERIVKPGPFLGSCKPPAYDVERSVKINSIKLEGREMFTTPAGNFDCHRFCMEMLENGNEPPLQYSLYYNKEAGFVQLEDYRRRVELISIKK